MKALFVCHRLPYPPKRGGKIRPFNIISHLSKRHEVTVCSIARSAEEEAEGQGLRQHCARLVVGRVSDPLQAVRMVARLPTPTPIPGCPAHLTLTHKSGTSRFRR